MFIWVQFRLGFHSLQSLKLVWKLFYWRFDWNLPGANELRSSSTLTPTQYHRHHHNHFPSTYIDGILPKGPYPPCLRMEDRALLAGYHRYNSVMPSSLFLQLRTSLPATRQPYLMLCFVFIKWQYNQVVTMRGDARNEEICCKHGHWNKN